MLIAPVPYCNVAKMARAGNARGSLVINAVMIGGRPGSCIPIQSSQPSQAERLTHYICQLVRILENAEVMHMEVHLLHTLVPAVVGPSPLTGLRLLFRVI